MSVTQISIHELLLDKQYRKYFLKSPELPAHYSAEGKQPWRLIIMRKGEDQWRSRRFARYADAFAGLKKLLPTISDGAINCPPLTFMPPVRLYRLPSDPASKVRTQLWRPSLDADLPAHDWCPHCRRPVVFGYGTLNVNRPGSTYRVPLGEPVLRCGVCGVSERLVDLRHPDNAQRWDVNRPKLEKVGTK